LRSLSLSRSDELFACCSSCPAPSPGAASLGREAAPSRAGCLRISHQLRANS
jgi:hypothetical protein